MSTGIHSGHYCFDFQFHNKSLMITLGDAIIIHRYFWHVKKCSTSPVNYVLVYVIHMHAVLYATWLWNMHNMISIGTYMIKPEFKFGHKAYDSEKKQEN